MVQLDYINKKDKIDILSTTEEDFILNDLNTDESLLIWGDNYIALKALLQKYKGKIDLIYIDPPFNTNLDFKVTNNRKNTISNTSSGVIAYSDKMSKNEYLEFIRERLYILRELLSEQGSIYLHIDYKIGHYIKIIMDEIFGEYNFLNDITRVKSNPKNFDRKAYGNEKDLILFYAKRKGRNIWNDIKIPLSEDEIRYRFNKIDEQGRRYTTVPLHAPGETKNGDTGKKWRHLSVPEGRHWRTNPKSLDDLDEKGHIEWSSTGNPRLKKYANEHKGKKIQDIWVFKDPQKPNYPTQKNVKMIERIIMQSSNSDSIVLDCFAGGGTTLVAASCLGRRWIGIDESQSAIDIINDLNLKNYIFKSI